MALTMNTPTTRSPSVTNHAWRRIAIPLVAIAALSGCGTRTYGSVEEAVYAGALCTDRSGTRVPDDYCPIGDGEVDGYPYQWRYQSYRASQPDIDVVYVGYQVPSSWNTQRPSNVTTINIDRGSWPADPPAGSRATSAKVETAPQRARSTSSARGGLGSTTGRAAAAAGATPDPVAKAAPRKSIAPPPAAQRPMGSASTKTTTKKTK